MKKHILLIFLAYSLFSSYSILNAVWDEEVKTEIQESNPADYDPWIPQEWIREDWAFGE